MKRILFFAAALVLAASCTPKVFDFGNVTCDKAEFRQQYRLNRADWDATFGFLSRTDLDTLRAGQYTLTPTCTAKIQELTTREGGKWERHEKVVDVFYVISGEDKVGISTLGALHDVTKAYDAQRDVETFKFSTSPRFIVLKDGQSVFLFPKDGHLPNQAPASRPGQLKVAVVKVPYVKK